MSKKCLDRFEGKFNFKKAAKNLSNLHPYLSLLIDKIVLKPTSKEANLFNRINHFSQKIVYLEHEKDSYIVDLIDGLSENPIMQSGVNELHWFRFFCLQLRVNTKNISKKYSIADVYFQDTLNLNLDGAFSNDSIRNVKSNLSLLASKSEYGQIIVGNKVSKMILDDFFYRNSVEQKSKYWDIINPGSIIFRIDAEQETLFYADIDNGTKLNTWFPFKDATAAEAKCNVYCEDMIYSLRQEDPIYYTRIRSELVLLIGMANDQVSTLISWHYYLYKLAHIYSLFDLRVYVYNNDLVKGVSDLCKLLGIGINPYLSLYTECDGLAGRGSKPMDLGKEFERLTQTDGDESENVIFQDGLIYQQAMKLMHEAMPHISAIPVEDRWRLYGEEEEVYWQNRHLFCVNGAHHLPAKSEVMDIPKNMPRTKMVFLENTKDNFMYKTKPVIQASLAVKWEAPKNRSIKSQDSISYVNEDLLVRFFERNWKHKEVLLDPSLQTKALEAERVAKMAGDDYVMLDFKGMELQHSLKTQIELTEARCDFLGVPAHMKEWLLTAEKNQFLQFGGKIGKMRYCLLTGRRSTTLTNTMLNRIYINIALSKKEKMGLVVSQYNVGDDVIMRCKDTVSARIVIKTCLRSKSVFNPRKMSWGKGGEFLRHSIYKNSSYGYLARSIASFVCGSWVNELRLAESDEFSVYQRYSWTLDNRGRTYDGASALYTYSLARRTNCNVGIARGICKHTTVVNGGPVVSTGLAVTVIKPVTRVILQDMPEGGKQYATDAYIDQYAKTLIEMVDVDVVKDVKRVFKLSSYKKGLSSGYKTKMLMFETRALDKTIVKMDEELLKKRERGVLSGHPTLPSMQGILQEKDLDNLAFVLLGKRYDGSMAIGDWLFGTKPGVIRSELGNNYDDLCQFGNLSYFKDKRTSPFCLGRRAVFF